MESLAKKVKGFVALGFMVILYIGSEFTSDLFMFPAFIVFITNIYSRDKYSKDVKAEKISRTITQMIFSTLDILAFILILAFLQWLVTFIFDVIGVNNFNIILSIGPVTYALLFSSLVSYILYLYR